MEKILRINMTELKIKEEGVGDYRGLGGRAITSAIISREVPPLSDPLGEENKLVIAPGLLAGTNASTSGRLSVGAKSPLTGGIKEANSGGTAGHMLANLGIAAIIVEGKPKDNSLYKLRLTANGSELIKADELKGTGNFDTISKLTKEYGNLKNDVSYITIGIAGELKYLNSAIAVVNRENQPTRMAARGGVGSVMGTKGLKAIIIDGKGAKKRDIKDEVKFREAAKIFAKGLKDYPLSGEGLPTYGTNVLANIINEAGGYPTRNWSIGQFEGIGKISGEYQHDIILSRGGKIKHPCQVGCTIQCSRIYNDKDGKYLTEGPEYESVWALGGNLGIDDFDSIALMNHLCNDIGLDTIEAGGALGVAMEAKLANFGDSKSAISLIEEIRKGSPLGRILGNGTAITGKIFGVYRVPVTKNQAMPAYDPRAIQGIGVTYATTPMGADHTAGYTIASNILRLGGYVDPLIAQGQVDLSRELQIQTAALDSTGLCLFCAFAIFELPEVAQALLAMINSLLGTNFGPNDIAEMGKNVLKIEKDFNRRAGFTEANDRVPEFLRKEKLHPHNKTFIVPDEEIDRLFNF